MAHSYCCIYVHYVFSTKNRQNAIPGSLRDRLWAYIGGIARDNHMKVICIGGTDNHVHVLVALTRVISIAKAAQLLKGGSSKWMNEHLPKCDDFNWQEGYGAFSVSVSMIDDTIKYIKNQRDHHQSRSFEEEYLLFLKRHNIDYEDVYVFG